MGLAATAMLLLLVEGTARIMTAVTGYRPTPPLFDPVFTGSLELGWALRPGFDATADGAARAFDADGYQAVDSAQVADTRTPRVVFIGDSNTFGFGVATESSFVEVADRLLPGTNAINLGVPGYSSAQGVIVARKYLPILKPKIAVISFNFNDRRYSLNRPDGAEQFEAVYRTSQEYWLNRLARAAEHSHAFIIFRSVLRRVGAAPIVARDRLVVVSHDAVVPRVAEDDYEKNLAAIVALCLENGVRPVFLLLRDNPARVSRLHAGVDALEGGDAESGIRDLEAVVAEDIGSKLDIKDLAQSYLSSGYRQAGRTADAAKLEQITAFPVRMDGQNPIRLDTDYNDAMRHVAETSGIEVLDAASVLEASPETFIDICHFGEDGHRGVGELVASHLAPLLDAE
jgi:lysophospholipase L1-like esterase